jgi:hypothetical protein
MRDKCVKIDIKLKHNFMNINAYRARHNEPVAPKRGCRSGGAMKPEVGRSSPWVQGHMVPPYAAPWL